MFQSHPSSATLNRKLGSKNKLQYKKCLNPNKLKWEPKSSTERVLSCAIGGLKPWWFKGFEFCDRAIFCKLTILNSGQTSQMKSASTKHLFKPSKDLVEYGFI